MPIEEAATPQALHHLFVEAFNRGDLESLFNLYEPDAALVPKPHQLARGQDAIRRALRQLLSLKGTFVLTSSYVIEAGDIALLRGEWRLSGTGPDGRIFETRGRASRWRVGKAMALGVSLSTMHSERPEVVLTIRLLPH